MPKIKRPVPETDQLVVRPIAIGIIQDILIDRMGLSKDIPINFPGFTDAVALPKGLISSKNEDTRFPTSDKLKIEVTESEIKEWLPASVTNGPEHIPLFLNRELEVEMRPIYASVEMRISVTYRAKGKTDARRFYDLMMSKVPDREDTWIHTLNYSFGIPEAYMVVLQEIHRLTELTAPYGDNFENFFAKWVNPRYGILTDQAGKNQLGVFSDTQSRVLGFFDPPEIPDFGSKKDDTEAWEMEFAYVVRYEKPKDIYFSYPIVIHNSVLSQKYRGTTGFQRYDDVQQTRTVSLNALRSFESMQNVGTPYRDFPGRYFPLFDEFMPRHVPQNTMRVFTTLVLLAPDNDPDPLHLMNIEDLEGEQYGFRLNDCIKDFLRSEHAYVTIPRHSAINVALYMGRHVMNESMVQVDENLNIRSTQPLNKRHYYHVRLSIVTDLTYLTEAAKNRLCASPCAFENVLEYITIEGAAIPYCAPVNNRIPRAGFDEIAERLKGRCQTVYTKTVQNTKLNAVYKSQR